MSIKFTNEDNPSVEKVEFVDKTHEYTHKRFKTRDILIGAFCLIAAFFIWCYANYVDDPIIQKQVTLDFVLVHGESYEDIKPDKMSVWVYGEESVLSSIHNNTITIYVDKSKFNGYDTVLNYEIDYGDNIHSHTKSVELKLVDTTPPLIN